MNQKKDLSNNNEDSKKQSELNNKDNIIIENENNDEVLTIGLYNNIISVIFNTLNNSIIRNNIKTNANILKLLELQISNLFFLETELGQKLEGRKYSRDFLQIISDITDLELSINKSPKKNRTAILEDCNLLIVTIINSYKNVERESLERIRTINENSFEELNNQITALNDFNIGSEVEKEGLQLTDNLNNQNINNSQATDNLNNSNMRDLNNNLANLSKLGVLPQHPATNPNFYPYLTKPKLVPKLRKILAGMLSFSVLFIITTVIISFFVKGPMTIDGTTKEVQSFVLSQINNWILIVITVGIYAWSAYIFLKPTKLVRETYHTSFFILVLLGVWLMMTVGYFFWTVTDNYYLGIFQNFVKSGDDVSKDIINQLRNLPNFKLFSIFSIITASVSILPIIVLVILILINPRLDRNKVIRANSEYQNAITAAMNGQKYDIDSSLFDKDDRDDGSHKKAQFTGRF